jgi:hypothetical protein
MPHCRFLLGHIGRFRMLVRGLHYAWGTPKILRKVILNDIPTIP